MYNFYAQYHSKSWDLCFFKGKNVFCVHQCFIYLIKNTVKVYCEVYLIKKKFNLFCDVKAEYSAHFLLCSVSHDCSEMTLMCVFAV